MAVLGKIRQKSIFLILVIGMALFAFVISGVFGSNSSNGGPSDPIGVINDDEINVNTFRQLVEQTERSYNYSTLQSVNLVWNQLVQNTVFTQQFDQLGIDAGKEQIEQILSSDDALVNNPNFQNEAGFFDFGLFTDYIAQLKDGNPVAYENWKMQEQSLIGMAKQNIYFDLIKASEGLTEAEAKRKFHLENDNINIQYIQIPFDVIDDSLVNVTDANINAYIKDRKTQYKKEASRNLQYVIFEEDPTEDDIAAIRYRLESLKEDQIAYNDVSKLTDTIIGFKNTKSIADFVDEYSEIGFDSIYKPKGAFNNSYADILFELTPGDVFGPYRDGKSFKISRFIDKKEDASIRASHILISYAGATRAAEQITRTKEEAQAEANRVLRAARQKNADFASLARQNSDGPTAGNGGDLGFFQEGEMATEFFNFCDQARVDQIGLVETEFGFHVIKVTDKDDLALIADVTAPAVPSDKTANEIFRAATQFEIDALENKDFLATAEQNNLEVRPVKQVTALEENLPGLARQRNIVTWAFDEETAIGSVRRFSLSSGGYVVVQLTAKIKEGVATASDEEGAAVRKILIANQKAALIKKQFGSVADIDALAEANEWTVETASALNQKNPTLPGAGYEPFVVGVAFGLNEGVTSDLIQATKGVYKVKLLKKNTATVPGGSYADYAASITPPTNAEIGQNIADALREVAQIEDNRSLYY